MIPKLTTVLLLLLLQATPAWSQSGFLYRKKAISFGVGTNFFLGSNGEMENLYFDRDLLLPKLNFGYHFVRKNDFFVEAAYHMLPNAYDVVRTKHQDDEWVWTENMYTTKMRSDNFSLTVGGRLFTRIGPIGFYWHFGTTLNLALSEVLDQHVTSKFTNFNDYKVVTDESSSARTTTWATGIPFGIGKVYALNERVALDIEVRASVNLFANPNTGVSFLEDDKRKVAINRSITKTSLIGIYANIQLFH